jgi:SAM-dependent methyltransferase
MQLKDKISAFPLLYHAHHLRDSEDLPFWLELSSRQGSPILELGSGTGRVLLPIAQAGYEIIGLDNDLTMLAVLRQNAPDELRPELHLLQGDMSAFQLDERFALVLLPCNTLSTLAPPARLATLGCVASHLRPGGLFAASLPNPALLKRLPATSEAELEDIFPHPIDGEPVQVSSAWVRQEDLFTITWHYDHLLPDGHVERLTTQAQHHLASSENYQAEVNAAGMKIIEAYGDFEWLPYDEATSPYLVLLAVKAG